MSIVTIISAIGNNSSVYPLIVRDCGIEVPSKIALTYNQNLKDSKQMAFNATRERFIDEYGTSIIWLGGIPAMNKLCDYGIKKAGYDPKINMNLYKEEAEQGLKYNIEKFKNIAPEEVKKLEKVLKNKAKYQNLQAGKFAISTVIPTALMGYVLPKLNFALTDKIRKKQEEKSIQSKLIDTQESISNYSLGNPNTSFKGLSSSMANMSTVNKMALTDGGLTVGRVGTARNKYEKMEMGFKMGMMMFLNFVFPAYLAKFLDYASGKLFNTNVNLDPLLINDKDFIKCIKNNTLNIPEDKNIIEFLDKNPDSKFSQMCEKYCGVKRLKSGIRDPRAYVDKKKISEFKSEVKKFIKEATQSGNIDKYANKALKVKSANILANVGISSFLLAVTLPKVTFILRKMITGSDAEPGLIKDIA